MNEFSLAERDREWQALLVPSFLKHYKNKSKCQNKFVLKFLPLSLSARNVVDALRHAIHRQDLKNLHGE